MTKCKVCGKPSETKVEPTTDLYCSLDCFTRGLKPLDPKVVEFMDRRRLVE